MLDVGLVVVDVDLVALYDVLVLEILDAISDGIVGYVDSICDVRDRFSGILLEVVQDRVVDGVERARLHAGICSHREKRERP